MDILDNYESAALAVPVDSKQLGAHQKRLDKVQNTINDILFVKPKKTGNEFWDKLKAGAFNNV
jgi:hypothetical protein